MCKQQQRRKKQHKAKYFRFSNKNPHTHAKASISRFFFWKHVLFSFGCAFLFGAISSSVCILPRIFWSSIPFLQSCLHNVFHILRTFPCMDTHIRFIGFSFRLFSFRSPASSPFHFAARRCFFLVDCRTTYSYLNIFNFLTNLLT